MKRLAFFTLALSVLAASNVACSSSEGGEEDVEEGALGEQASAATPVNLPFYFAVPKHSLTHMTAAERQHPWSTAWNPSRESAELGLRIIAVKDTGAAARQQVGEKLGQAGVLKTGDVVLSFRTNLADTIPYAHIQMGTTHAGVARVQRGVAHTVDQPLDTEHNSPGKSFQAPHYMGLTAFHIVRPRALEQQPARREALDAWLGRAEAIIGTAGRPGFNSNYLAPAAAHPTFGGDPAKLATAIGKGLLKGDIRSLLPDMDPQAPGEQQLFCSELAYHLLTLSNCSEDEIRSAGDVAECTRGAQPFPMMSLAGSSGPEGLGEGPLLSILAAKGSANGVELGLKVFTPVNEQSSALSAGHRGANAMLTQMGAVKELKSLYEARVSTPAAPMSPLLAGISSKIPANYSPTAFLIDTLRESTSRQFDYVATVVFLDDAALAKAKTLAQQAIPNTDSPR